MRISIIIPMYNEAACIGKTLRHIQQHSDPRVVEILAVDGGSTDQSVALALEAGAKVIASPEKGRAIQMNLGARQCSGDILYFVHADSIPPVTFLDEIEAAVSSGWQLGNFRYQFDSNSRILRFNAWFTRFPFMFCQGGDKTLFVRRDLFEALNGYDPAHVVMEEYDFMRRAKQAGHRWVVLTGACLVSARKYVHNSWLRVQVANIVVFNLWAFRLAKPGTLRAIYRSLLA